MTEPVLRSNPDKSPRDGARKQRLGDVLLHLGFVSEPQLREALRVHAQTKCLLGQALLKLGHIDEEPLAQAVAQASGLEYVNFEVTAVEAEAAAALPEAIAKRHNLIPYRNAGALEIATDKPPPAQVVKSVERLVKKPVRISIASRRAIQDAMARLYEKIVELDVEGKNAIEIVNDMISKAMRYKASDIHLEPFEESVRLRFRVDGILQEASQYPISMLPSLTSRIKILAGLDIAERRSPQDGAFVFGEGNDGVDLRVSSLPCIHGEKIVMRILAGQSDRLTIKELGLSRRDDEAFAQLIKRPYGIILIVGPTGSGKSTTLCAALNTINGPGINITTVEDPVEYKIEGINQVQISKGDKISFADALRSILRQDPDVIMVGETRDPETASISLRASLTGHLVFTTLHTNDAPGALPRLVDMGCEPFLVGSSVSGVLAQRLLRRLCPRCKEAYSPTVEECLQLEIDPASVGGPFYRSVGCPSCMKTGFRGRTGIFELLVVDEDVRAEVMRGGTARAIAAVAEKNGMTSLRQDGVRKVIEGVTSVEEVLRTTVRS